MAASTISAASSEDLLPLNLAPYSVQNLSSSRFCSASRKGQPHGRLGIDLPSGNVFSLHERKLSAFSLLEMLVEQAVREPG
jgi:hypothetical protein